MSAPAKEPQPLGSTTGKREDVRICVRCGKELQMAGRNAKYCLLCRGEVYRERARAYRASHHASADTGACPSAQKIRFCQRCGVEIKDARPQQKWCADCHKAVKAQQSRQSYIRRHEAAPATKQLICQHCGQSFDVSSAGYARAKYCPACRPVVEAEQHAAGYERKKAARSFAGPYMTNPRPADVATRAAAKAQVGEDRLRLLSNVADWAGISYGRLMAKSPAAREALILDYKAAKGGPHEQNRLRPAGRCAAGAGRLVHPADVRPGPCGGQHPPVNKAAPPDEPDRAGPKGELRKRSPSLYRKWRNLQEWQQTTPSSWRKMY